MRVHVVRVYVVLKLVWRIKLLKRDCLQYCLSKLTKNSSPKSTSYSSATIIIEYCIGIFRAAGSDCGAANVSISQHTSAYVIRQHTSAIGALCILGFGFRVS